MKYIQKIVIILMGVLVLGVLASCNKGEVAQESKEEKKEVLIWYWGEEIDQYAQWYTTEINPNVEFKIVHVLANEYYQKWIQTYLSGGRLPDIGVLESSYRELLLNTKGAWENLEEAPYGVDKRDLYDYTIAKTSNDNKELVSIEMGLTPACLGYKTDISEKYLGIKEPEELEQLLPTWERLLEVGQEINQKSNGEVFLFSKIEDLITIIKSQQQAIIVDTKGTIDDTVLSNVVTAVKDVYDHQIINPKLFNDSDAIHASIAGEDTLFYVAPIWAPDYIIKPSDPYGGERWRLMNIPGGNVSIGGTSVAISTTSEVKAEAFDFIQQVFLTQQGAKVMTTAGALSACQAAYTLDNKVMLTNPEPYFGHQNISDKYIQAAQHLPNLPVTKYSQLEDQAIKKGVEAYLMQNVSLNEMIEIVKIELQKEIKELDN